MDLFLASNGQVLENVEADVVYDMPLLLTPDEVDQGKNEDRHPEGNMNDTEKSANSISPETVACVSWTGSGPWTRSACSTNFSSLTNVTHCHCSGLGGFATAYVFARLLPDAPGVSPLVPVLSVSHGDFLPVVAVVLLVLVVAIGFLLSVGIIFYQGVLLRNRYRTRLMPMVGIELHLPVPPQTPFNTFFTAQIAGMG